MPQGDCWGIYSSYHCMYTIEFIHSFLARTTIACLIPDYILDPLGSYSDWNSTYGLQYLTSGLALNRCLARRVSVCVQNL